MQYSYLGIVNLDFVIFTVTCCLPEPNVTNFKKDICIDIVNNAAVGMGGGAVQMPYYMYITDHF